MLRRWRVLVLLLMRRERQRHWRRLVEVRLGVVLMLLLERHRGRWRWVVRVVVICRRHVLLLLRLLLWLLLLRRRHRLVVVHRLLLLVMGVMRRRGRRAAVHVGRRRRWHRTWRGPARWVLVVVMVVVHALYRGWTVRVRRIDLLLVRVIVVLRRWWRRMRWWLLRVGRLTVRASMPHRDGRWGLLLLDGSCPRLLHELHLSHSRFNEFLLAVLLELALDSRVPVILDVVVAPSWQLLGDVGPAVPVVLVHRNQYRFLVVGPIPFLEFRVEVIDESFPTLLALPSRQMRSNFGPFPSVNGPLLAKDLIFFGSPRPFPFDAGWVGQRLPMGQTLNCRMLIEIGCNFRPPGRCVPILLHKFF